MFNTMKILFSALINKLTFSDWFLKNKQNKQIINLNWHMPSILILIPSFDNKHTINVIVYIRFDVNTKFKERKEKNVNGCKFSGYGYPRVRIL